MISRLVCSFWHFSILLHVTGSGNIKTVVAKTDMHVLPFILPCVIESGHSKMAATKPKIHVF